MLRGLAFSAVADAYDDENDDGNDVRSHLEKLLNAYAEVRDVVVNNEKSAERMEPKMLMFGFQTAKITSAMESQPLSPKPLLDQTPQA